MNNSVISKLKIKGIIYLFVFFLLMAGSTAAWLYFEADLPKKTPIKAKQVFLWHNNLNPAQTNTVKQT
ncbi:hypothetical protein [Sporomusa termitida]|uniref:Uncharacterized protein n=1 Tax=Sporomusa termitida TaxID=2377 RepID=A0A517DU10_9FIRM|nr:hypothetical protein [Sporomusa termitida]QDR80776.1 hypothetical protein SPTER_21100 [Sporomusa termitida]